MHYDIIGLCEIRRLGEAIIEKDNGDIFCYKGETKGQRGVGFLIKNKLKHMITEIVGVSERIMILKLEASNCKITIIQIYAPTENSSEEEIENFYTQLESTMENHKSQRNFILGDFNSKVGKKSHLHEDPVGPYGYGKRNERGERLVQFATEQRMKIVNTFFRKRPSTKWTWRHPNGRTKNEIDFILSDSLTGIADIQVAQTLKLSTDHRLVRIIVEIKRKRRHFRTQVSHKIEDMNKTVFTKALQEKMQRTDQSTTQDLYNSLEETIIQAATAACPTIAAKKRNSKLSQNTLDLMERRKNLQLTRDENEANKIRYAEIDKQTNKKCDSQRSGRLPQKVTNQILESTKLTRKARRQVNQGKQWILRAKGPNSEINTQNRHHNSRQKLLPNTIHNQYKTRSPQRQQQPAKQRHN